MTVVTEASSDANIRRFSTADTMYAEAEMVARANRRVVVIVEGEDDQMVLAPHSTDEMVLMTGPGGRNKLLELATRASDRGVSRMLFVADSDYDVFSDESSISENVVKSRGHDLFMEVFKDSRDVLIDIVRKRLESRTRGGKVQKPEHLFPTGEVFVPSRSDANDAIERAVCLSRASMAVRASASRYACPLNFKRMKFGSLVGNVSDIGEIFTELLPDRNVASFDIGKVREEAERIYLESSIETLDFVGDHDFLKSLSAVLGGMGAHVKYTSLQDDLIIACRCSGLLKSPSVIEIKKFAESFGKKALKCPC